MTSKHLQQNLFNTMSYAEDSHAKIYPKRDAKKASQKLQGLVSGFNSSEPYAWYDQNTSSWKTYQRSLVMDWTSFSETFTRQGLMNVRGQLFQQAILEQHTNVTDGICLEFLPTPTASDIDGGVAKDVQFKNGSFFRVNDKGERWGVKLRDAVLGYIIKNGEQLNTNLTQTGENMMLNPQFSELLMGFPLDWTKVE
tara:strand:+ start:50 stop:637 length:588 start_codon:yes stop_codon:yes gene_type:complete